MKTIQKQEKGSRAFTLIETVVSIALVATAIVGPMTISARGIRASSDARLNLEAIYLSTEAVEVLRSIRDNASGNDNSTGVRNGWLGNIVNRCGALAGGCVVNVSQIDPAEVWRVGAGPGVLVSCNAADCTRVYQRVAGNGVIYQQPGGNSAPAPSQNWIVSPFTRLVQVTEVTPGRHMRVTVTVTYRGSRGVLRTLTTVDDLYNWFPYLQP